MKRTRAFTLLEILLVLLLMGLVGGMGLFAFQRATRKGEARGVTQLVAEELRGARNRAISQRIPVAVVLPGGRAQALYVLEGEVKPRVTRRVLYGREYPQSELFVGLWPTATAAGRDDIQTGSNGQEFSVSNWQIPNPRDYVLMFTPAGTVKSNGWPHFSGDYHLVVSEGVVAAPTGAPAGAAATSLNYLALSQVGLPSTISISPAGGIKVQEGLTGLTSGVVVRDHALSAARGTAPPSLWTGVANRDPVISLARLDPAQTAPYKIYPKENVSLVIEATDPDGDPLYVQWSTVPANLGRFSLASESKMEWDPKSSRWKSCWSWTTPEGWPPGTTCRLRYQVSDGRGGSKTGLIAGDCVSFPASRLAFSQNTPHNETEIVASDPDGKNATFVTEEGDAYRHWCPSFSPDGQLIASLGYNDMTSLFGVFLSTADGSQTTKIFESSDPVGGHSPCWASNGTQLVFSIYESSTKICRMDLNGGNRVVLAMPPADGWISDRPECSPRPVSGQYKVLYSQAQPSPQHSHIYAVNLSGGAPTRLTPNDGKDYESPTWSRDASKIAYCSSRKLYVAAPDGSSRNAIETAGPPFFPTFSPNGDKIAYMGYSSNSDKLYVVTSTGAHVDTGAANDPKLLASEIDPNPQFPRSYPIAIPFCWSPDGEQICWRKRDNTFQTVNVYGARVSHTFLQPAGASNTNPSWWGP